MPWSGWTDYHSKLTCHTTWLFTHVDCIIQTEAGNLGQYLSGRLWTRYTFYRAPATEAMASTGTTLCIGVAVSPPGYPRCTVTMVTGNNPVSMLFRQSPWAQLSFSFLVKDLSNSYCSLEAALWRDLYSFGSLVKFDTICLQWEYCYFINASVYKSRTVQLRVWQKAKISPSIEGPYTSLSASESWYFIQHCLHS